jgi:adenylate cyclase
MTERPAETFLLLPGGETCVSLDSGQSWTIGRGKGCEVALESNSVSRLHALIQRREPAEYYLVDLGSRNGSFVNGHRVSFPVRLRDNDRLEFGEKLLIFRSESVPVSAPASIDTDSEGTATDILRSNRIATILVVDLRDFTVLAQTLSEELLSQTIGTWFLCLGRIARAHGSWAEKYIGDAVMAVWSHVGLAKVRADLERILQAVCEIHAATNEVSRSLSLPVPLRIGVGINSGPAVVGGSDNIAMGNTVNAAFRLEAATKSIGLGVALGEATFLALEATAPNPFKRFQVPLKGYEGLCTVWAISFEDLREFIGPLPPAAESSNSGDFPRTPSPRDPFR